MSVTYKLPYDTPLRYLPLVYILKTGTAGVAFLRPKMNNKDVEWHSTQF